MDNFKRPQQQPSRGPQQPSPRPSQVQTPQQLPPVRPAAEVRRPQTAQMNGQTGSPAAQTRQNTAQNTPSTQPAVQTPAPTQRQPIDDAKNLSLDLAKTGRRSHAWLWWMGGIVAVLLAAGIAMGVWYQANLRAPHPGDTAPQQISILEGSAVTDIARTLESEEIIKNAWAFQVYYRLNSSAPLQAGEYTLTKNLTVAEVIAAMSESQTTQYDLTFLPGESVLDVKKTLLAAGFNEADIDAAFEQQYPAFTMMAERPAEHDIEGFIFPDTYRFEDNYTVENILQRPFEHMQAYIAQEGLEEAFAAHGMTLYEGITLASIIQKEVNNQMDMAHVSQVFHSRLEQNIPLGSDPTFVYPAQKMGVQPLPSLESPYNTYNIQGLPPGPIANPGKEALYAAAHPSTDTDDLFFVAGDDGQTYFSKTNEEHERLTREHCNERCRLDIF